MPDPDPATGPSGSAARRTLQRITGGRRRSTPRPAAGTPYGPGRDPQLLAAAVPAFMAEQGWEQVQASAILSGQWSQIVGQDLAQRVQPESFVDGVLTLRAESTAWATQVRLLLPHLRAAIDGHIGPGVVTDIRVQGPQAPTWVRGPRRVKGRGPRDTYG
jgi:predicted nucleic acid-binding Zn ribbon protein